MDSSSFFNILSIVVISLLVGWGVGSLLSNIGKIRGWKNKYIFWIFFLSYSILLIILNLGYTFGYISIQEIYLYGLFIVGVAASIGNWILVRTNWFKSAQSLQPTTAERQPSFGLKEKTGKGSANIFISYRRSDSADVSGRIYDRLVGKFGKASVFKDVDSIPLGIDFKDYLDKQVGECNVLLAIIGKSWLEASDPSGTRRLDDPADFVRIEIESALNRGIPVIPLLVQGAHMPLEENLPDSLRKLAYRNGIQIRHDPDFHHDMDRLIASLERNIS